MYPHMYNFINWVEPKDVVKYSVVHTTAHQTENYLTQNDSSDVDKSSQTHSHEHTGVCTHTHVSSNLISPSLTSQKWPCSWSQYVLLFYLV